jgi:hypothetical protein
MQICASFLNFLEQRILCTGGYEGFVGNRVRRAQRTVEACNRRLRSLWLHEPRLGSKIGVCLENLQELSWLIQVERQILQNEKHVARERANEFLYVFSAVARFCGARQEFCSLKSRLSRKYNCEDRAIEERIRNFTSSHNISLRWLAVERYLEEFRLGQLRKKHPEILPLLYQGRSGRLTMLSRREQCLCERIAQASRVRHPKHKQ